MLKIAIQIFIKIVNIAVYFLRSLTTSRIYFYNFKFLWTILARTDIKKDLLWLLLTDIMLYFIKQKVIPLY